jgi:hypothetical protein
LFNNVVFIESCRILNLDKTFQEQNIQYGTVINIVKPYNDQDKIPVSGSSNQNSQ